MLALSVFYQSRKAYRLLSKLFALPSKRTLQKYMQNTNIMPGFNDGVFDVLKLKVENIDPKDKCVSLIFDEMALKSALVYEDGLDIIEGFEADYALAFMVRGLYTKWKQPLACSVGSIIHDWRITQMSWWEPSTGIHIHIHAYTHQHMGWKELAFPWPTPL